MKATLLIGSAALILATGIAIAQPVITAESPVDYRWDGTYRRADVPILMYHYISTPPDDADAYRRDLSTPPDDFHDQMEALFYEGYTPVTLGDLDRALLTGAGLPAKPVILTFDDGYADHYAHAFPILREFGFVGTFFIITGRADANDPNHLSWTQIAEMAAAGMQMESHTKDHLDLRGRDHSVLIYQLLGSFESLAAYIGRTPQMFAYPIGHYDAATLAVLGTMPVLRAVTTQPGTRHTTDNRLELTRVRVPAGTSVRGFLALLGG